MVILSGAQRSRRISCCYKKSSERDWVQGAGDPSTAVGMTSGWSGAKLVVANGSASAGWSS
ncbi:hypothetical protein [Ravibacter arvi]|uniref:hypothetical protein n=1 Tax=Ravibacter arvi TaxID=2051041 RepID=UPI0031EEAE79